MSYFKARNKIYNNNLNYNKFYSRKNCTRKARCCWKI